MITKISLNSVANYKNLTTLETDKKENHIMLFGRNLQNNEIKGMFYDKR